MKSSILALSLITLTLSSCSLTKSKPGVAPQPVVAKQALDKFDVVGKWKGSVTGMLQLESDRFSYKIAASVIECKDVSVVVSNFGANKVAQQLEILMDAKCVDALGIERNLKIEDRIALTSAKSKYNPNKIILESKNTNYWGNSIPYVTEIGSFQGTHASLKAGYGSEGLGTTSNITGDVVQTSQDEITVDFSINVEHSNYFVNQLDLDFLEVKGTLNRVVEE